MVQKSKGDSDFVSLLVSWYLKQKENPNGKVRASSDNVDNNGYSRS
jgi:hypothetical protein